MQKLVQVLKSRTFWTLVVMVLVNGIPSVRESIPASAQPVVDIALGLLATYFHVNPSQKY